MFVNSATLTYKSKVTRTNIVLNTLCKSIERKTIVHFVLQFKFHFVNHNVDIALVIEMENICKCTDAYDNAVGVKTIAVSSKKIC